MMLDHGSFSCLLLPHAWGMPKFKLGDFVKVDGVTGVVVGYCYYPPENFHSEMNNAEPGLWAEVLFPPRIPECPVGDVLGFHQDVIQPVLTPAVAVIPSVGERNAPINTLYAPIPWV